MLPYATPSSRAAILDRRTYCRPIEDEFGEVTGRFETHEEQIDRVIGHQRWLWQRAKGGMTKKEKEWVLVPLNQEEEDELLKLRYLLLNRQASMAGRTHWLGGTSVAKEREASMFNCSFAEVKTSSDVVDCLWLLLQGCGVGFRPVTGVLNGFMLPVETSVIRSTRGPKEKGRENTIEKYDPETRTWTISVGDSAEGWARAIGKLIGKKYPALRLVLDLSEIRGPGGRLKGYGWISSGDTELAKAFSAIADIMSDAHSRLLKKIEILDIMNWLGTILSSRRSAEICLVDYGSDEWYEFATAKKDCWKTGKDHRQQSNNSILFEDRPSLGELRILLDMMVSNGGSEPGLVNAREARRRAPWFRGLNPCAEILLSSNGFCNLLEPVACRFNGRFLDLIDALRICARANYRQTCVDLRDGVLQDSWHEVNDYLHLCGVGMTGLTAWEGITNASMLQTAKKEATHAACEMADALGMSRPKAITTVKPSGTRSKVSGTVEFGEVPEGAHNPLGKWIFNWVEFDNYDENLSRLEKCNYELKTHPYKGGATLVKLPVEYPDTLSYTDVILSDGRHTKVIIESAVDQLNRYKMLMDHYVDHNCSITISYDPSEIPEIADWLYNNWSSFVAVSFLFRNDPTKTAEDLGYPYLPQEVTDQKTFEAYTSRLLPFDPYSVEGLMIDGDDCATGACPVR